MIWVNKIVVALQIILWSTEKWEKRKSCPLQLPAGRATTSAANSGARLQYNFDQVHVLASNETQISIYDTIKLQCVKQVATYTYITFLVLQEIDYVSPKKMNVLHYTLTVDYRGIFTTHHVCNILL